MSYAYNGPDWTEILHGQDVVIDDIISSYATVMLWSPQERAAAGIREILESEVPAGKIATGSTLVDDDGEPRRQWMLADVPSPTLDDYRRAIQARIDMTAGERGYDSGVTCASYVGSTNTIWAAEAAALVAWRDAVWTYAYAEMAKVQTGERNQPVVAAFLAELPTMSWPA